jgi:cell division protein FtsQ
MKINRKIKKVFVLICWLIIASGVTVLLVAAINIKNRKTCNGIDIQITGVEEFFFLDKADIQKMIGNSVTSHPVGKPVHLFNLQLLEEELEKNTWVRDAELFFDNNMVLHINIAEREPIARVFTVTGNSFYIDSSAHAMPLSDKMSVRLPVFTGFPALGKKWRHSDSLLMYDVKTLAQYISSDEFFKAQIAQIDINGIRNFEMVPTIGNHLIVFGDGENCENKFRRLKIFYQQVLAHAGFDKYSTINVSFDKQILATRKGSVTRIDSLQAVENIRQLVEESKRINEDSIFTSVDKNLESIKKRDSTLSINEDLNTKQGDTELHKITPVIKPQTAPEKQKIISHTVRDVEITRPKPKPKAVMPRLE